MGNAVFPLLEEYDHLFVYACDFSPRGIEYVKVSRVKQQKRVPHCITHGLTTFSSSFCGSLVTTLLVPWSLIEEATYHGHCCSAWCHYSCTLPFLSQASFPSCLSLLSLPLSPSQSNPQYDETRCHAFQCDLTCDKLTDVIPEGSVHLTTLLFVLSAISPDKMAAVVSNIHSVLRPGGQVLLRDYGLFDHAMLRFGRGHKIQEQFYVRQDGTRAYYFTQGIALSLSI